MNILHVFDDRNEEVCNALAEIQKSSGSRVELFNINGKNFLNLKLIMKSKNVHVIHMHGLAGLGKWIKRFRDMPIILQYSKNDVESKPLYQRQRDEKHFDKILVDSPELLDSGYHSNPQYIDLKTMESGLMKDLYRIYNEALVASI